MPNRLQELGGWTNPEIIDIFVDYAKIVLDNFGDRVKFWTTFNEPWHVCEQAYGQDYMAPAINYPGIPSYLCGHNLLKAHAKVYHVYKNQYKHQNGEFLLWLQWFNIRKIFLNSEVVLSHVVKQPSSEKLLTIITFLNSIIKNDLCMVTIALHLFAQKITYYEKLMNNLKIVCDNLHNSENQKLVHYVNLNWNGKVTRILHRICSQFA